jgi:hypothetical protein
MFSVKNGEVFGYSGFLTNNTSLVQVRATQDTYVALLPRVMVEKLVERYPRILTEMGHSLELCMPQILKVVDFTFSWTRVPPATALFKHGDERCVIIAVYFNLLTFQ